MRVLLLLLVVCFVQCQEGGSDIWYIDDYSTFTSPVNITTPKGGVGPLHQLYNSAATVGAGIIGSERDVEILLYAAEENETASTFVSEAGYVSVLPRESSGYALAQYDGNDGSITLHPTGLGGIDLTSNGAYAIRIFVESASFTMTSVTFYSFGTADRICYYSLNLKGTRKPTPYILEFKHFKGECDFTRVGAIEIMSLMNGKRLGFPMATRITSIATYGNPTSPISTPTLTPSATPSPGSGKYVCCYYYNSNDNYESCFCQEIGDFCPTISNFYPVGNETVTSCTSCSVPDDKFLI